MRRNCYVKEYVIAVVFSVVLLAFAFCTKSPVKQPEIKIHYLGHSSFILQFDNGVTVLMDYGKSNSYGLDSPIYDIGSLRPDVVIYSHTNHVDHYDSSRVPADARRIVTGPENLSLNGLDIKPVPTCEGSLEKKDCLSWLFTYKGYSILHLGDAQTYIKNVNIKEVQDSIKETYPDKYDLLMMPIGWIKSIEKEAADFVNLLRPGSLIPMHYWSPASREEFLSILEKRNSSEDGFHIKRLNGAEHLMFLPEEKKPGIQVVVLNPASYISSKE